MIYQPKNGVSNDESYTLRQRSDQERVFSKINAPLPEDIVEQANNVERIFAACGIKI